MAKISQASCGLISSCPFGCEKSQFFVAGFLSPTKIYQYLGHIVSNTDSIYWALATFFLVPRSIGISSNGDVSPTSLLLGKLGKHGPWLMNNSKFQSYKITKSVSVSTKDPYCQSGWWYTYPSEKWWSSSIGMIIPFPTEWKVIIQPCSHQPDGIPHFLTSLGELQHPPDRKRPARLGDCGSLRRWPQRRWCFGRSHPSWPSRWSLGYIASTVKIPSE